MPGLWLLVGLGLTACSSPAAPSTAPVAASAIEAASALPSPVRTSIPSPTPSPRPSLTPRPRTTFTPGIRCLLPREVSADDQGKVVVICGRVVDEGERDCPTCQFGVFSYLTFESGFDIISYDWDFHASMEGACLMASDTVELLGGNPVFVFGKGEGYAGSKCTTGADGVLTCRESEYFLDFDGCR